MIMRMKPALYLAPRSLKFFFALICGKVLCNLRLLLLLLHAWFARAFLGFLNGLARTTLRQANVINSSGDDNDVVVIVILVVVVVVGSAHARVFVGSTTLNQINK